VNDVPHVLPKLPASINRKKPPDNSSHISKAGHKINPKKIVIFPSPLKSMHENSRVIARHYFPEQIGSI
jgi:hypothetical protein